MQYISRLTKYLYVIREKPHELNRNSEESPNDDTSYFNYTYKLYTYIYLFIIFRLIDIYIIIN